MKKCPHCDSHRCVPEVALLNCESYGSQFYNILCRRCKKPVRVYIERSVRVGSIEKGTNNQDDFGFR